MIWNGLALALSQPPLKRVHKLSQPPFICFPPVYPTMRISSRTQRQTGPLGQVIITFGSSESLCFQVPSRDFYSAPSHQDQRNVGHQQGVAKMEERWMHSCRGQSSAPRTVLCMGHYCNSGHPGLTNTPLPSVSRGSWHRWGTHVRAVSRRPQVFIRLFFFIFRSVKVILLLTFIDVAPNPHSIIIVKYSYILEFFKK